MIDPATIGGFVVAVGKSSLVNTLRDGVVSFLVDKVKDIAGDEIKSRIESLRSDAKLNKQIQNILERAAQRWAEDSPDDELVSAVAKSTTFTDMPSIQQAIREIAQNPFSKITAKTLQGGFKDVLPARFDQERIERGVSEFINILQEEFVAITALQPTIQTFASLNTANATAVLPHIQQLLEQLLIGPSATDETLQNYLTWVIDQHRYLDPKGTMQTTRQVQVLLDDVYVSLEAEVEEPLSGIDRKIYEEELSAFETRESLKPEEREDFLENLQAKFIKGVEHKAVSNPVELAKLVRKHEKMVILGDPGAGKTTLLRYLALRHAQAKRQSIVTTEELGEVFLPVYLRIAEYAENGNGQSMEDFLIANVRGRNHRDKSLPDLINTFIKNGECIVFLDGLDEVIEPSQRALISAQINSLCQYLGQRGNRFVVTSRVAGYRSSPLDGSIPHYRMQDMNLDQIMHFLNQWCNAVERFQTPTLAPENQRANAQKEIDSITHAIETNPGIKRLAANPLLLRTMAQIHKTSTRIPQRRIELYRVAADLLIRGWNLARGIPEKALAREADANRLLAELAAWMHENRPAGLATEGDIRQKLSETISILRGKEPDHPDVETEAIDFLNKIRQHTGLFVERAPKRFGFMHLTFEEYFAARWLVAKPRDASRRIRNKLHRPRWEEPILLAIGFYGMEFPDDVTELVEESILGKNLGGSSPYEEILCRDLLFAVRAVGDQDVDVQLRNKLAEQFMTLWLDGKGKGKYQTIQNRAQNIMKDIQASQIGRKIFSALLAALKDENKRVRASAAVTLRNIINFPEAVNALLTALKDENEKVRASAAFELRHISHVPAESVTSLLAALKDENAYVRAQAAYALSNTTLTSDAVALLLAALKDEDAEVRFCAAFALSNTMILAEAVFALLGAFKDENVRVRARAVFAISNTSIPVEAVTSLITALKDKEAYVRTRAAFALGNATLSAKAINALLAALDDENQNVQISVLNAIHNVTLSAEAVSSLLTVFQDENANALSNYALYYAKLTTEAVNTLILALQDENAEVRSRAIYALRYRRIVIFSPEAIITLITATQDSDDFVSYNAKGILFDTSVTLSSEGVTTLLAAFKDENEKVRASAAVALSCTSIPPEAVTSLLAALKDENENVRASAAVALNRTSIPPEAVTPLLAALKDENENVRANAVSALRYTTFSTKALATLLNMLKDENAEVRSSATYVLRSAQLSEEAVNTLLAALKDENEKVRANAVSALRNTTFSAKALVALLITLKDENTEVRSSATYVLRSAQLSEEAVNTLLAALRNKNENVRAQAAYVLSSAKFSREAVNTLLAALRNKNENVRIHAARALREVTVPAEAITTLLTTLIHALKDKNVVVRISAASALCNATNYPEAISAALLHALKDENAEVRANAASALRNATFSPKAVDSLHAALKDKDVRVRAKSASALHNATNYPRAVVLLIMALQDESAYVRASAASALSNATLNAKAALALLQALQDENVEVRSKAAITLSNAALSTQAIPILLVALKDKHENVRAIATSALRNATISVQAIPALLAALQDENENVRANAASALDNAAFSAEVIPALLVALKDKHENVRVSAAYSIREISNRLSIGMMPELLVQLRNALQSSGWENFSYQGKEYPRSYDSVFDTLNSLAPFPNV